MNSQGTGNCVRNLCLGLVSEENPNLTIETLFDTYFQLIVDNSLIRITNNRVKLYQTNNVKEGLFEIIDDDNFSIEGRILYYSNTDGELLAETPLVAPTAEVGCRAPTALLGRKGNTVRVEVFFDVIKGLRISLPVYYGKPNVYTDVCVLVEGKKFYVPKAVLAMRSKFFEDKLLTSTVIDGHHEITLENVSVKAFTTILDLLSGTFYCVYNGPEAHMAFYEELLSLTERFGMQFLDARLIESIIKDQTRFWNFTRYQQLLLADKCKLASLWRYLMEVWTESDSKRISSELLDRLSVAASIELVQERRCRR